MTAGDDAGKIWVYDVGDQVNLSLCLYLTLCDLCFFSLLQLSMPHADEWSKFMYTMQDLKNNQQDEDFELKMMGGGHHHGHHHHHGPIPGAPGGSASLMLGGTGGVGGGGGSGPGSLSSLPSMSGSPMR